MYTIDLKERLELVGGSFPDYIDIEESVDTHHHYRNSAHDNDGRMEMVVHASEFEHEYTTAIGNTNPALLTGQEGLLYKREVSSNISRASSLKVMVSILVTDSTDPKDIIEIRATPHLRECVQSLKIFFGGVSNDYGNNVSDVRNIKDVLRAAADPQYGEPLPVTIHAERAETREGVPLDPVDREWYCITHDIVDILAMEPRGKYVIRHMSDGRTVAFVRSRHLRGFDIHGEICPQYCIMVHSDLYKGQKFHGHWLYWPIVKDPWSRQIILDAALECPEWVHFATDFAMHIDDMTQSEGVKITSDGDACGGLTLLPWVAKSIMITTLLRWNQGAKLKDLLSRNARRVYGLPPAKRMIRYVRRRMTVPEFVYGVDKDGNTIRARVFLGGQESDFYVRQDLV